jgi:deoxyhypusine synthase
MTTITKFIDSNYHHFNAASLKDAAQGYKKHVEKGGKMFVTLAGAMSTAELGISLAEMIRKDKVHAICCTGANLEEDFFNAIAHDFYKRIPNYRDLTPQDEQDLVDHHFNRVTDTCIPEEEAMRRLEGFIVPLWKAASDNNAPKFPHEFMYDIARNPEFIKSLQIPKENSWLIAAAEKNLPIFVPGWEDSTFGNFFIGHTYKNNFSVHAVKTGLQYMRSLVEWYKQYTGKYDLGFFQVGGGIAGDFPICVVPLIHQDLEEDAKLWQYFCQITDAQESYGGYSGALPNEKITWGKLAVETPKFVIHSDATIVAPLIFNYVLGN